jgi:hypothetical protein
MLRAGGFKVLRGQWVRGEFRVGIFRIGYVATYRGPEYSVMLFRSITLPHLLTSQGTKHD